MQEAAGTEFLVKLSALLRKHGEHIVRGDSKLCLTVSSLLYLNGCFKHLKSDRGIQQNGNSIASEEYSSVVFLHDCLHRTLSLKLVPGTCSRFDILVNISCFKNLQYLEIKKVPLGYINGLQSIRTQLRGLICTRCVIALNEVFISCGGDLSSTPFAWQHLNEANLSYNGIEHLDDSLKVLPVLEILNLSHNSIECPENEEYWQFLNGLYYLNLGYNRLNSVPVLPPIGNIARFHLTTLILRNNNLHNLEGVQHFMQLTTLDVSNNCIAAFQELSLVAQLHNLLSLYLEGNPVCFHADYRLYTVACLSPVPRPEPMYLDGKQLTILEQSLVGSNVQPVSLSTYIPSQPLGRPKNLAFVNTHQDVMESSQEMHSDGPIIKSAGRKKNKKLRKPKTRQIALADAEDGAQCTADTSTTSTDRSLEHSEDIQRLEKARDLGGKHWLPAISRVVHGETPSVPDEQAHSQAESSVYLSAFEGSVDEFESEEVNREESRPRSRSSTSVESPHSDNVSADAHQPFLVTLKTPVSSRGHEDDEGTELFVTVTEHFIRERECTNGKVVCKLEIGSLVSASVEDMEDGDFVICLKFDYISRDRKERYYVMEDTHSCQHLMELLMPVVKANEESKPVTTVEHLECLKCSAQFTKHPKSRDPVCPDCGSTRIIEISPPDGSRDIPDGSHDSPHDFLGANLNSSSIRTVGSDMSVTVLVPFSSPGSRPSSRQEDKKPGDSWVTSEDNHPRSTPDVPQLDINDKEYHDDSEKNGSATERTDYDTKTFTTRNTEDFVVNDRDGRFVVKSSPVRTSALSQSLQESHGLSSLCTNNDDSYHGDTYNSLPSQKRVQDSPISLKTSSGPVSENRSDSSSADISLTKDLKGRTSSGSLKATSLLWLSRSISPNPNIIKSLFTKLSGTMPGPGSTSSSSQGSHGSSSSESRGATPIKGTPRLAFKVSPDEFRYCDHRLKLYFEVSLFKGGADETFACLLKNEYLQDVEAPVVVYGSTEETSALLVVSNIAVYMCRLIETGGGSPDECLSLLVTLSLDNLQYVDCDLDSQSFRLEFDGDSPGCYAFHVRDKDRCEDFLQLFMKSAQLYKAYLDRRPVIVTRTNPQTLAHIRAQVLGVVKEDLSTMGERFREQSTRFTEPPLIKDRKSLLRSYSRCFVGKEFVDWLLRFGEVDTRNEALLLGQRLLDEGIIEHVSKETKFEDKEQFYKFAEGRLERSGSGGEENGHEDVSELEMSVPEIDINVTAAVMAYRVLGTTRPHEDLDPVTVIVTRTHIALAEQNPQWPFPRYVEPAPSLKGPHFLCVAKYKMTDVTSLEFYEDEPCYLGISISEEDAPLEIAETHWLLRTETVTTLSLLVKVIKDPWETQFGVELQTTLLPTISE